MNTPEQPTITPQHTENDTNDLVLETFVPFRIVHLASHISRTLSSEYAEDFHLSIAEWRIMANLGLFGPLSAMALAEKGSLDKARVTRALVSMQEAGLIHRAIDEHDQRIAILSLSEKGLQTYQEIAPLALRWEKEFLSALTAEETDFLDRIIDKLAAKVKIMAED